MVWDVPTNSGTEVLLDAVTAAVDFNGSWSSVNAIVLIHSGWTSEDGGLRTASVYLYILL